MGNNILNGKEIYQAAASLPPSLNSFNIITYIPKITPQDIDNGYVMRYFSRPASQKTGEITEIDLSTYNNIQNTSFYTVVSIPWQIRGQTQDIFQTLPDGSTIRFYTGIITANKQLLQNADLTLSGMIFQITNYTEYYQGT